MLSSNSNNCTILKFLYLLITLLISFKFKYFVIIVNFHKTILNKRATMFA